MEQESYDSLPNMVIILNPNGTVNEELMLANGMNVQDLAAVKALAEPLASAANQAPTSITALQHPLPKKLLTGVQPVNPPRTIVESAAPVTEHSRSVILDPKEDFLVLDDIGRDPMIEPIDNSLPVKSQPRTVAAGAKPILQLGQAKRITTQPLPAQLAQTVQIQKPHELQFQVGNIVNGTSGLIATAPLPITELGTLDLSLPKKPDPSVLEQYVNPAALVPESNVLKALSKPQDLKADLVIGQKSKTPAKPRRKKDENSNSSILSRKSATSLGALGQALHGKICHLFCIVNDQHSNNLKFIPMQTCELALERTMRASTNCELKIT